MLKLLNHKNKVDKEIIYTKLNDLAISFCLSQIEDDIKGRLYLMNLSSMEFRIDVGKTDIFYQFGIRAINILISLNLETMVEHNHLFIELNLHHYNNEIYYCIKSIEVSSDFSMFNLNEEMAGFAIHLIELNKDKSILSLENFSIEDIENNNLDISSYKSISCTSWQVDFLTKYYYKQIVIYCNSSSRVRYLINNINNLFKNTDNVLFYISDNYKECKNVLNDIDRLFYKSKLKYGKNKYYTLDIKKRMSLYFCEFIRDFFDAIYDIYIKED